MLHLPVSVLLIYNEKAIHSLLRAYLMVTLNHGMKMLARGGNGEKHSFFFSLPFFDYRSYVRTKVARKDECVSLCVCVRGGCCHPNLKCHCLQLDSCWELCTNLHLQ